MCISLTTIPISNITYKSEMSIDFSVLFFFYFIILWFLLKFLFFTVQEMSAPVPIAKRTTGMTGGIRKCKGSGRIPWLMESTHKLFLIDCASWPGLRCRYLTQTDLDVLKRCPCLGDQKLSGGWRNRSASLGLKTETSVRFKRILNAKANCQPIMQQPHRSPCPNCTAGMESIFC